MTVELFSCYQRVPHLSSYNPFTSLNNQMACANTNLMLSFITHNLAFLIIARITPQGALITVLHAR